MIFQCYETDSVLGDPAVIALISVVSVELIKALRDIAKEYIKRSKTIEISVDNKTVKLLLPRIKKKLCQLLNSYLNPSQT